MRRTAPSLAVVVGYLALWAYAWTHGEALPSLNSTAEQWAFFLSAVALHVAIGYVIASPWAVALALTPGLILMLTGASVWVPLVTVAWGMPIAACIGAGVVLSRHRERVLRAIRARELRPIGMPVGVAVGYVVSWAYVWTPGGDDLPTLSSTGELWAFALVAIAVHVAIGYLLGNPWATALAAAPALTVTATGTTAALLLVMIAQGIPIAAFIAVGVLLRRHRETRFHAL